MSTETNIGITVDTRTLPELKERLDVLENEIASIKAKLDKVRAEHKATGQWADPDWYRRAMTRQRFLGVEHQRLCRRIAELKREARSAHNASVERAFIGAAKLYLTSELFGQIMQHAEAEVARG